MTTSPIFLSNPTDIGSTILDILEYRATHSSNAIAYEFYVGENKPYDRLTYAQLREKSQAIASQLIDRNLEGERVLLIYPAGLEFITAFLGCLYAGAIAVPIYPPRRNQKLSRLETIVDDCTPKAVLTVSELEAKVSTYLSEKIKLENCLFTDKIESKNIDFETSKFNPDKIAFLQYTSGSTGNPKGVIITHQNITSNSNLIYKLFGHSANSQGVSWLPFYHDMGLIGGVIQPLFGGFSVSLFSPTDFLRKPLLWLETISRLQANTSGAPNFAYELCMEKISSEDKQKLDLSSWDLAFIGAEPIQVKTLDKFAEAFAECGFKKSAFYPCYGMAEATLIVSGGVKGEVFLKAEGSPKGLAPLRSASGQRAEGAGEQVGTFHETSLQNESDRVFVSSGKTDLGQKAIVVNSDDNEVLGDREVGEIWIEENDSIAAGYWNNQELTKEKFQARISNSNKVYLRTGDLGFISNKELFVTGRIKDVIIIRGQNYYPQDIERVVERSHPALRANAGAAFSVEIEGKEQLVIVQEVERSFARKLFRNQKAEGVRAIRESPLQELKEEIESAINSAVSQEFGLNVYDVQLIKTGSISKTSSGKIQRYLCKENYLAEEQSYGIHPFECKPLRVRSKGVGEQREQREKVSSIISWLRSYAEENINSQLIDERRCIPPYIVLDFGNKGLLGMQIPQEYGGLGLNNYETMQILEQLGAIDTTLCLFVGLNNILGIRPILNYGSEELKQELLPLLSTGRELAAFALTEKGAGSNPQAIASKATASSENSWNIQGEKIWSGSAAWAGVTNVFVQHEDINGSYKGISAFAVRRGTPGLRQGKESLTMGMKGMVQNTIHFDNVPVNSGQMLGKPGKGMEVAQDAMMYGRLTIAFSCLGGMKRCAQLILRYVSRRQVSTGRLLNNPVILTRLGELTAQITAVECLVTQIAKLLDRGVKIPVELYTACKTSAPEFYWQAADSLVQFLGGRGYIETNIAPQILRDARILRIFEGPTETLNMFLGSRIVNQVSLAQRRNSSIPLSEGVPFRVRLSATRGLEKGTKEEKKGDFIGFIRDILKSADVCQQLFEAVEKIECHFENNPEFDKSLDNKRWVYSLVGQVATHAILLAATKHSYQRNSTEELKRAVDWAQLQFEREIEKVIASHKSLAQEADKTTDMIESYGKAIGNIQQNLAGEDRDVDELLESRGVLKDTATHKGAEEQGKNNLLPVTCPSGAEHSLAPVGDAGSPLYPLPITPTKQQKSSEVEEWLSQWLSSKLQIPLEKIDRAKAFADYGIDSVMAVELAQDLEEWLPDDLEIEPTLAWNFPSIEALAGYLTGEQRSRGSRRVEEKTVTRYPDSSVPLRQRRRGVSNLPVIPDNEDKSKIHKQDIDKLSEDELARSLLEEIALAKERDN